ncbi:hypothetical protein [Candidatus Methanoperedens nitratireducens]|uniref:DUF2178 domain-containing protein n=1 Tax=Candidatus Methanoperedens nitratireducens TaxID=1392998 RepID=A0A284VPX5_9EURY|nr:hypothetical protein [Candidatus Methanoperedens nitroreducens]SNQ61325.1 conserved membrane hypothetical protein [Candidatus Methanoperedens nitroreducens]
MTIQREIEKANDVWLILVWIYIAAAVYSILYSSFFFKEVIMSAAGVGLLANYFIRNRKYKDDVKTDEMAKRISGMSSNFAFITAIAVIAVLSIALDDNPGLIDAKGVLVLLAAVIVVSKIAGHLYYTKVKKEIGF